MIKRLFLSAILCVTLGLPLFATQMLPTVSIAEALAAVESKFEGKDVDIYYINNSLSTTWDFFVDAEPLKGWEHECYVFNVNTKLTAGSTPLMRRHKYTMPPKDLKMTPAKVKNRYGANVNLVPQILSNQNTPTVNPVANRTYALIISGGVSPYNNYSRYWNDCSFIYQTLVKKYNIPKSNICPIMSDGNNPAVDMFDLTTRTYKSQPLDLDFDGVADIKYSATKSNIQEVLNSLLVKLKKDDHLFIYVIDHGGTNDNNMSSYIWLWNYEKLQDKELAQMVAPFTNKLVNVNVVLGQCFSGGFVDDLEKVGCVVATASKGNESSYGCPDIPYDEFVYHWTCAINEATPDNKRITSDSDNNNLITMEEAFNYAKSMDRCDERPQYISLPLSIGEDLAFNHLAPASDIYVKDNWNDTGKEPNTTTEKAWISPSIWCRNQDDNIEQHQNPEYSKDHQQAFIYVKVYNRGKETFTGNKWVQVYWANASTTITPKTWKGRELYANKFATGGILEVQPVPTIEPGDSATLRIRWSLPNVLEEFPNDNLHFCLLAKILDTPYDDGYIDGKPYFNVLNSNKQAQKNVSIITKSLTLKPTNIFVRNISDKTKNYTLELVPRTPADKGLFLMSNVEVEMTPTIYDAWVRGGKLSTGVSLAENTATNGNKKLKIIKSENSISGVNLSKDEFDKISLRFLFDKVSPLTSRTFTCDLIQRDEDGNIVGGETFIIESPDKYVSDVIIDKNPTPKGEIRLSVDNEEYSSYLWKDGEGNDLGSTNEITIKPSSKNSVISVTALTSTGEMATGAISLTSEYGINSIRKISESLIEIEFKNETLSNSMLTVTSIDTCATKFTQELQSGETVVSIDISTLTPGMYAINYFVNGKSIDSQKFNK